MSSIHNLIIGKIYVDHGGVMRITSSATGMACKLKFKEQGLLSRHEAHEVCTIFDPHNRSACLCLTLHLPVRVTGQYTLRRNSLTLY